MVLYFTSEGNFLFFKDKINIQNLFILLVVSPPYLIYMGNDKFESKS